MLDKIEHLGIAVKSLEISDSLFAKLIGREAYKMEEVEREGVKQAFTRLAKAKSNYWKAHVKIALSQNS